MTYVLIAIAVLLVWFATLLAGFRLVDRQIDDPESPQGQRERTFSYVFIGLGMGFVLWNSIDPLTALGYRIDNIRPLAAQCRAAENAEACARLARIYRDGVSGACALHTDVIRRECVLVAPNATRAEEFTRRSCAAGRTESCLRALPPPDSFRPLQPVKLRCQQGEMLACDDYLAQFPLTPLDDLLPEARIQALCHAGNASVCLRSARDELLRSVPARSDQPVPPWPDRFQIEAQGLGSYVGASPSQILAATALLKMAENITLARDFIRPGSDIAMTLRAQIADIALPGLSEGASF
ncbi:hypothetical protein [Paracoccus sp. S1E-3]|uniref:hypothetical protein n=1 Tax=Paracoccus sp. S1E-3 TaxID=2756130 RepID=UPI0015EF1538|nr:hypothetical protein [Paracoccus sp. S1E-3]MBA4490733.1 hypothetical protein [Paracoccus sp. S1E-3]